METKTKIILVSSIAAVALILVARSYKKGMSPVLSAKGENDGNDNASGPASVYNPSGERPSGIYNPGASAKPAVGGGVANSSQQGSYSPTIIYGGGYGYNYPYLGLGICEYKDIYGNKQVQPCNKYW